MTEVIDVPAPLQGCLYCHAEGTTTLTEGRKILGLGSGLPVLTCSNCGSVAFFEQENGTWRIRYKNVNKSPRFYYVMLYLGKAGWLTADQAVEMSRNGFVQRQRVLQTQRGDFSWLHPAPLEPPPPLMSPDENVYLRVNPVTFQQSTRAGSVLGQGEENVLDSGRFYVTNRKLHLLGHRRDWSHKLSEIKKIEHTDREWRIYVGESDQYYQADNFPDQIDAQLFTTVVKMISQFFTAVI